MSISTKFNSHLGIYLNIFVQMEQLEWAVSSNN